MSAITERQADMAGDTYGDKTQEEPQAQEDIGGTVKILAGTVGGCSTPQAMTGG